MAGVRRREEQGVAPLTAIEVADHFNWTLQDSQWAVVPDWHALRHSFASICPSRGIDKRLTNAWMGHQTAEQQKRYQHPFPEKQQDAIRKAFG